MHVHGRFVGVATLFVGAAVLFAACGGGSGGEKVPERPPSVPANAPFIDQEGLRFKPNVLTAKVGQVAYFANSDSAIHTVTINSTNESGTMKPGAIFQWTPAEAGTFKITCDFHPAMKATITVTE